MGWSSGTSSCYLDRLQDLRSGLRLNWFRGRQLAPNFESNDEPLTLNLWNLGIMDGVSWTDEKNAVPMISLVRLLS
jgi:hypothetical protein